MQDAPGISHSPVPPLCPIQHIHVSQALIHCPFVSLQPPWSRVYGTAGSWPCYAMCSPHSGTAGCGFAGIQQGLPAWPGWASTSLSVMGWEP